MFVVACSSLLVLCCSLCVVCCLPSAASWRSLCAGCLLFVVVRGSLRCVLFVACCLLIVGG